MGQCPSRKSKIAGASYINMKTELICGDIYYDKQMQGEKKKVTTKCPRLHLESSFRD